ncbi:MAG TPA: hypothetical protein VHX38_28010 [Pseudonocardiaceae bacterium]|jgi:hypothetical protein|nr:hypothetical protein [Pseudonocardiaceae bacterium]
MSEAKQALVLHLAGANQPLLIAVSATTAQELSGRLSELMQQARVEAVDAANGSTVSVNFAAVQAAHVDTVPSNAQLYGSPPRPR